MLGSTRTIGVAATVFWVVGMASLQAGAVEVYLNGVKITGVGDQVIDRAKVVLDARGDVHIEAPRYKVKELRPAGDSGGEKPIEKTLFRNYYLVTEATRVGGTGRRVRIIINGRLVKELTDNLPQHIVELNAHLKPGINSLSLLSDAEEAPSAASGRVSSSERFSMVVGEGSGQAGGTLRITKVLAEFAVTGADRGKKSKTFTIEAR